MRSTPRLQSAGGRAPLQRFAGRVRGGPDRSGPCPLPAPRARSRPWADHRRNESASAAILKSERSPRPLRCKFRLGKAAAALVRAIVAALLRCNRLVAGKDYRSGGAALRTRFVWWSALPMLLTVAAAAVAQPVVSPTAPAADQDQIVTFSADQVSYDNDTDVVTASGEVRMNRGGN